MDSAGQSLQGLIEDRPHQNDEYRRENKDNYGKQNLDRSLIGQSFRPCKTFVAKLVTLDSEQLPDPNAEFIRLDNGIDNRGQLGLMNPFGQFP